MGFLLQIELRGPPRSLVRHHLAFDLVPLIKRHVQPKIRLLRGVVAIVGRRVAQLDFHDVDAVVLLVLRECPRVLERRLLLRVGWVPTELGLCAMLAPYQQRELIGSQGLLWNFSLGCFCRCLGSGHV